MPPRAAKSWTTRVVNIIVELCGQIDDRRLTRADPLGPDSLTWKYFGDLRTGMLGVWIGAIQNMYPELGAGVEDHSILLREPLQRVARSVYPIMGVVYDGDRAAQTGAADQGLPQRRSRASTPKAGATTR